MKHTFATVSVVLIVIGGLALPISDMVRAASPILQHPFGPGQGDYPVPADVQRLADHIDGKAPGCLPANGAA